MIVPTTAQLAVRDYPSLSLLVVAPAGCGKTETLALRIAGLIDSGDVRPPRRILATTFTNRAKDNLRSRLRDHVPAGVMRNHITVANFHGLAARIIRAHAATIGLDPAIELPDGNWVKEQCHDRGLNYQAIEAIDGLFRTIKQQPLDDAAVVEALRASANLDAYEIEQHRIADNRATYDDLLRLAELILAHDAVAELYRNHFGAVIVDEYQDLTAQQLRVLTRIGQDRITFAGDLAQGIYSFTGARPAETEAAIRRAVGTHVVEFDESHRSSPAVLNMVNALNTVTGGTDLRCAKPHTWPAGGLAALWDFPDQHQEAKWITHLAKHIHASAPNHRIGVISRIKSRLRFVDHALDSTEMPVHRWEDGVLDTDTAIIVKQILHVIDIDTLNVVTDRLAYLVDLARLDEIDEPDTRRALIDALVWVLDRSSAGDHPDQIANRIRIGHQNTLLDATGVHLLSGHVGKGQQFDWVVVVGAEDDSVPFFRSETAEEILEEARIFSVMISRARHGIVITHAANVPTAAGYARMRQPSRFLPALIAAHPLTKDQAAQWLKSAPWNQLQKR